MVAFCGEREYYPAQMRYLNPKIIDKPTTWESFDEEEKIEGVVWTGSKDGGKPYVGVCQDRSIANCKQCLLDGGCRASLNRERR